MPKSPMARSILLMLTAPSSSLRLHSVSQGAGQTRPQTDGKRAGVGVDLPGLLEGLLGGLSQPLGLGNGRHELANMVAAGAGIAAGRLLLRRAWAAAATAPATWNRRKNAPPRDLFFFFFFLTAIIHLDTCAITARCPRVTRCPVTRSGESRSEASRGRRSSRRIAERIGRVPTRRTQLGSSC